MSDKINDYLNDLHDSVLYYTSSLSPYLQGVELQQPWQLAVYSTLKIRGNSDFVKTIDGIEKNDQFFDETSVQENFADSDGNSSNVVINKSSRISQKINHQISTHDLGTSTSFVNGTPFTEYNDIDKQQELLLTNDSYSSLSSSIHSALVYKSLVSDFNGVIDLFETRKNIDKKIKSVLGIKANIFIETQFNKNEMFSDKQSSLDTSTTSFFDESKFFGDLDVTVLQEKDSYSRFFLDNSDREISYLSSSMMLSTGTLTADLQSLMTNGFVSESITYRAPNVNFIGSNDIYSRRGFIFSQNENYKYDSIAYAGLNRRNRE
jgi:hypothetical protein